MTEESLGRMKTVLLSATEVLEDIAVHAAIEDCMDEIWHHLDLFLLQMREEVTRWQLSTGDK